MLAIVLAAGLGSAHFHATGAPACQQPFLRGLLQLHSFMYDSARDDFHAAVAGDPGCAIARWGLAMTFDHPIWSEEDLDSGRKAIAEVKSTAGLSRLEVGLIEAARALYGDGDSRARHGAWLDRLARLHEELPRDDEAALFHALALIVNSDNWRNVHRAMDAAAIALEVLARKPDHPGAAHYAIHALDTPDHAILALPAARRYARVAPESGHALHMPSHIFIQLGMWRETEASNVASFAASEKEWARRKLPESRRDWHSLLWLTSARLELGRPSQVEPLLETLQASLKKEGAPVSRFSYSSIAGMYLSGTGRWQRAEELLAPLDTKVAAEDEPQQGVAHCQTEGALSSRRPWELLARLNVARLRLAAAAHAGDEERARAMAAELESVTARLQASQKDYLPPAVERLRLLGAARIAQARAGKDAKLLAEAIEATRLFADADEKQPLVGPMLEPLPRQDLGDLLLAAGRPSEAMAAYRMSLERRPNLSAALLGLAQAARAAGDASAEAAARAQLAAQWRGADADFAKLVRTASR
jgi:tetratricopeptide (TPR) repeat protein